MSKLFFDHLVELKNIDKEVKKIAKTPEEREEIWALIDEIIHHKVMGCVLDNLPRENHEEFLEMYHKSPHNEELLFGYLKSKASPKIEELIKEEIIQLENNLLNEIHPHSK